MTFIDAIGLDDLSTGEAYGFAINGSHLVAVKVDDDVFVLDGYCTHERAQLSDAPIDGFTMYCPRHFSSFDVRTGDVLGPPAEDGLRSYATQVVGGRVLVDLDGEGGSLPPQDAGGSAAATANPAAVAANDGGPPPGVGNQPPARREAWLHRLADGRVARWWSGLLFRVVSPAYGFLHRHGIADWLNGSKPLGHPLHPALTDLPFGLWAAGCILYIAGIGNAAAIVTIAGVVAAIGAVITGLSDWAVSEARDRRVGALHGGGNLIAVAAEIASIAIFYAGGGQSLAMALCLAGLALSVACGYLGGHLVFDRGAMVNHAVFPDSKRTWTTVGQPQDVPDDGMASFKLGDRYVIISRRQDIWSAIEATCSHAGARLDQGSFLGCTVTCPLHKSVFSVVDGAVIRGPAVRPQPCLEVRVEGDSLQVRGRS